MAVDEEKYNYGIDHVLRDTRNTGTKIKHWCNKSDNAALALFFAAGIMFFTDIGIIFMDILFLLCVMFFRWVKKQPIKMPAKLPSYSKFDDPNNTGGGRSGKAEGIMYLGNKKDTNEQVWFTNSDVRTHLLYLGTTGSGKTEGLKAMVTNALTWGSGFVYIDGKADTDLWSSLSSLCRRFGRDDDLLVLNYMTGNSDKKAPSNSLNPFSSGSASYLTNLLVSLMPPSEGDNAMWKERAVSLLGSIMPALTYMRDTHDMRLSVGSIRKAMDFPEIIKLSRNEALPEKLRGGIVDYLKELPGYADAAFDDNGQDKPMGPDTPQTDTQVPKQQHGYLTMQFTRSLQSLGDDYGYIFDVDNADVDMVDMVLNRRILVVLIPALEKSGDETANLGKIVAATLKGMMGSTLGSTVEGDRASVIENKPTNSATPYMTVFDEVGYYATEGMAVMAAQARSLGFSLVYSAQDLPALEKRVKEEARSITANCNIKIFGKLEDPTQTKEFFEKTVGKMIVTKVSGYQVDHGSLGGSFSTQDQASIDFWDKASYDGLLELKEGGAVLASSNKVNDIQIFYCNPDHAKAMRVQKMLGLPNMDTYLLKNLNNIAALRDRLTHKSWTAAKADVNGEDNVDLNNLLSGLTNATEAELSPIEQGAMALAHLYATKNPDALDEIKHKDGNQTQTPQSKPQAQPSKPPQAQPAEDNNLSWDSIMGQSDDGADDDKHKDEAQTSSEDDTSDEGNETQTSSGSSDSRSMALEEYDAEDAIAQKATDGTVVLPDTLSDEVKDILKSAADNLTAGLFNAPTMDQYAQGGAGDSKGFKAKIAPTQQPGKTGR